METIHKRLELSSRATITYVTRSYIPCYPYSSAYVLYTNSNINVEVFRSATMQFIDITFSKFGSARQIYIRLKHGYGIVFNSEIIKLVENAKEEDFI